VYPDFQIWVVDRETQPRRAIGYACSVPVRWDAENPSARGLDWALTDGVDAPSPNALCTVVAGIVPEYRRTGLAEAILRRLGAVAAGQGLEGLVAPVRPAWKGRVSAGPRQPA